MTKFAWVQGATGRYYPQVWRDSSCEARGENKEKPIVLRIHTLTEEEAHLPLTDLVEKYPCPLILS